MQSDHPPQHLLEIEKGEASSAILQVLTDQVVVLRCQLPIEVPIQLQESGATVDVGGTASGRTGGVVCFMRVGHRNTASGQGRTGSPSTMVTSSSTGVGVGLGRVTRPRELAKSYNCFCSAFLPRCRRLMTVPMGMSRISAISL